MDIKQPAPQTIDEYIAGFPPDVQTILGQIRQTAREAAPNAEETIRYKMPTFMLRGRYLVYFGAYKKHIGFYPAPIGVEQFQDETAVYASGSGTLKFPLDQPIPFDLIARIIKFRVQENAKKK